MVIQKPANPLSITWTYTDGGIRAERTIQRLRGRRLASLSPKDKDALIASLATLVVAAGSGRRPSPHVSGDIVSWIGGSDDGSSI